MNGMWDVMVVGLGHRPGSKRSPRDRVHANHALGMCVEQAVAQRMCSDVQQGLHECQQALALLQQLA